MNTNSLTPEQYTPLFKNVLKAATKFTDKQAEAIRQLLAKGEGRQAYTLLFDDLDEAYNIPKEYMDFCSKNEDVSKLRRLFYEPVFENLVELVKHGIGEDRAEAALGLWNVGEAEIAWEILFSNLEDTNPPLPPEVQQQLIEFAEGEDKDNQKKWDRLNAEMTPEQIEKYNLTKGRTDYADTLRQMFGEKS